MAKWSIGYVGRFEEGAGFWVGSVGFYFWGFAASWVQGLLGVQEAQRLQYSLIREYTLNHIRGPAII